MTTPVDPIVYLSYTQAQLDSMYEQRQWAPNAQDIFGSWAKKGEQARATLAHWRHFQYGASPDERLDVFPAANPGAPIHVHVHGGRWLLFGKDDVSFMADAFLDFGITLVALDFSKIGIATLSEMVDQIRRAIHWVHTNARSFGGNPDAVHVSGHSSGAHLLACALFCNQAGTVPLPGKLTKSALLVSGIYDMRPVVLSARASYVKLNRDEVQALSPILASAAPSFPVMVAWGSKDNPEFKRQSGSFVHELSRHGADVRGLELQSRNHFEAIDDLGRPGSELHRIAVALAASRVGQLTFMARATALIG